MNSDRIFDVIEKIAATSSKNEKQALVAANRADPDFMGVLKSALDPLITYGLAARPPVAGNGVWLFGAKTKDLLLGLVTRQLTGGAAIEAVKSEMRDLTPNSAELLWRIISKDLRAGFGASTVNKAAKGAIPTTPYMRCSLVKDVKIDKFSWAEGCYSQLKADGMFANLNHEAGGLIQITSREGQVFPLHQMAQLVQAASDYLRPESQTHGELLVTNRAGWVYPREVSNGMLNKVLKGGELDAGDRVRFLAWDQIPLKQALPKHKYQMFYYLRLANLHQQLDDAPVQCAISIIETREVRSLAEAYEHYREMLARGNEGTVVKDRYTVWEDTTSKWQVKLKLEVDVDLEVVGFLPGEGKNAATFGSVLARTSDGLLEVGVSGFKDAVRHEINNRKHTIMGSIMAVRANSVMVPTEDGKLHSLFLPRFVEFRLDKTQADNLQRVKDQFAAAVSST